MKKDNLTHFTHPHSSLVGKLASEALRRDFTNFEVCTFMIDFINAYDMYTNGKHLMYRLESLNTSAILHGHVPMPLEWNSVGLIYSRSYQRVLQLAISQHSLHKALSILYGLFPLKIMRPPCCLTRLHQKSRDGQTSLSHRRFPTFVGHMQALVVYMIVCFSA